ncbi:flagellar hook-length control protein FliK [Aestuariibius insulae]|uniref:flagellar hook-length control protein FliK n=1 Tax=Aestuariibius insulae TaxID=2058287 RepID=UPI00345E3C62
MYDYSTQEIPTPSGISRSEGLIEILDKDIVSNFSNILANIEKEIPQKPKDRSLADGVFPQTEELETTSDLESAQDLELPTTKKKNELKRSGDIAISNGIEPGDRRIDETKRTPLASDAGKSSEDGTVEPLNAKSAQDVSRSQQPTEPHHILSADMSRPQNLHVGSHQRPPDPSNISRANPSGEDLKNVVARVDLRTSPAPTGEASKSSPPVAWNVAVHEMKSPTESRSAQATPKSIEISTVLAPTRPGSPSPHSISLPAVPLAPVTSAPLPVQMSDDSAAAFADLGAEGQTSERGSTILRTGLEAAPRGLQPVQADPAGVVRQISAALSTSASGQIEITLSPEELGQVRLQLTQQEGKTVMLVTADRSDTLDLLRRNADLLLSDFTQMGYDGLDLQFQDRQTSPDAEPSLEGDASPATEETAPQAATPPQRYSLSDRLDLRL